MTSAAPAPPPPPAYSPATTVEVTLGNLAEPAPSDAEGRPRFNWTLFAMFKPEHAALVDRVEAKLHPSFQPTTRALLADIAKPGYWAMPQTNGWGVFDIIVNIHWAPTKVTSATTTELIYTLQAQYKKVQIEHAVTLMLHGAPSMGPPPPPPMQSFESVQQRNPYISHRQGIPRRQGVVTAPTLPIIDISKPKDEKHSVIAMVVDRSGSMASMGPEVKGGCNAYLDQQRESDSTDGDGARTTVLLTTFDNKVEIVRDGVDLTEMEAITDADVRPRGSTALYDAIGAALTRTVDLVNSLPAMPSVCIFILTDGAENASRTWSRESVFQELTRLQAEPFNWDFYFAAANQDAMATGKTLGVDVEQCLSWSPAGAQCKSAMSSAQRAYSRKKAGFAKGFSAAERKSAMM